MRGAIPPLPPFAFAFLVRLTLLSVISYLNFILICGAGSDWVRRPLGGPLHPAWATDEYGVFGGVIIGRGNRNTHRKLSQQKSDMTSLGIARGPQRWEA
jgi:hypothetical protein